MYKNLVFKGGGVRGIAYAGALKALEDAGITKGIERTAGSSAGAPTALLVALKKSAAQIKQIIATLDFASFMHAPSPVRLVEEFGWYSNEKLMAWVDQVVTDVLGPDATFKMMADQGYLDYHCLASIPNIQDKQVFSAALTPDESIVAATVASASIPGFFPRMKFPSLPGGVAYDYVDAGLVENYPLALFDQNGVNPETLGMYVHNYTPPPPLRTVNIFERMAANFQAALAAQDVDDCSDYSILSRTIMIDSLGISSTNFNLSDADKERLYNSGLNCATKFLT